MLGYNVPDNEEIYGLLETIKESNSASIVYVLNKEGIVVSSSSYGEGKNLTGNNYEFRPYFTKALHKENFVYSAVGITSFERGIYFSSPVLLDDEVIGVVVIKMGLEKVDELLSSQKYEAVLISPEGVIFASNSNNLYGMIYDLNKSEYDEIMNSHQFPESELKKVDWKFNNHKVTIKKETSQETYFFTSLPFQLSGWEIILYSPVSSQVIITTEQSFLLIGLFILFLSFSWVILTLIVNNKKIRQAENELLESRKNLEKNVKERTKDLSKTVKELNESKINLEKQNKSLESFNKFAIERELKMIELKKKIKELELIQAKSKKSSSFNKKNISQNKIPKKKKK